MYDVLILLGALILIILGLIVAYKGVDLMTHFIRSTGGLLLGIVFFIIGGIVGILLGPLVAIVAAIVAGIIGFILGFIFAPSLLWLLLSLVVFVIFFNIGSNTADALGAGSAVVFASGLISGLLGSWLFSHIARRALAGATSVIGGLLVGTGTFMILLNYQSLPVAAGAGAAVFMIVSLTGYGASRPRGSGRSRKRRSGRRR